MSGASIISPPVTPAEIAAVATAALDPDLTAIAALASTGIAVRTAADTWAQRGIAGTTGQIVVTNGDGVAGNPVLAFAATITTAHTWSAAQTYAAGNEAAGSLQFVDANSAFFRPGSGQIAASLSGMERFRLQSSRLTFSANALTIASLPAPATNTIIRCVGTDTSLARFVLENYAAGWRILTNYSGGSATTPSASQTGDALRISIRGFGSTVAGAEIDLVSYRASSAWTDTSQECEQRFRVVPSGSVTATETMRLHSDGGISINSSIGTSPGAGQILCDGIAGGVQTVSTTGSIAALNSSTLLIRLTGAAPSIQGIAAPTVGARMIRVYCVNAVTLKHNDAGAAAANRITSDTGADIAVSAGKTVVLIYDPTSAIWRPVRY